MNHIVKRSRPSETTEDRDQLPTQLRASPCVLGLDYNFAIEAFRDIEYPTLRGTTYLDHAGTTPHAKSVIERWSAELTTNLFGNPHSASASSQLSTRRIDDIRLEVLKFFNASPESFDVVFVANATAAIKLVAEAFRDNDGGFWYGYHDDAHTSLIGARELASQGWACFGDDDGVEKWLSELGTSPSTQLTLQLFGYPGQSNMTGRRLPWRWCKDIRAAGTHTCQKIFTLFDAASLASTAPLDLSDPADAPDFTALSFYKIFGFPDLGALIVRKESGEVLMQKRYFAGGTVDSVTSSGQGWHAKKAPLHAALEEGTLPFHNILALDHAMTVHRKLFGSMRQVSMHTRHLAGEARENLKNLRHYNGVLVCEVYGPQDPSECGSLFAINLKDSNGRFLSAAEVEKLCIVKGIQIRTGGLCNPGGISRHLNLTPQLIRSQYEAGKRCGGEDDLVNGQPTGAIRISFGAMSTKADLQAFTSFIQEYFVERNILKVPLQEPETILGPPQFFIDELSVFPVKSCAAYKIPSDQRWPITARGLGWDREWCLVHEGTNVALSQKRYPRMALLQPAIDLVARKLTVSHATEGIRRQIQVDLDEIPSTAVSGSTCNKNVFRLQQSKVCGDSVSLQLYTSNEINSFFSDVLEVPCCLARCDRSSSSRVVNIRKPKKNQFLDRATLQQRQLALANESPLLIVSRSSVHELNRQIRQNALINGDNNIEQVSASAFRPNIVVAERFGENPYIEDRWTSITISPAQERLFDASASWRASAGHVESEKSSTPRSSVSVPRIFDRLNTDVEAEEQSSRTSLSDAGSIHDPKANDLLTPHNAAKLDILGPCQRCQMVSINQTTALSQQEPFSTLAKTRRKGDGRVWFGVHASLSDDSSLNQDERFVQVGDLAMLQLM